IACDSRSNSEIVVPVLNAQGQLIAVLDVDSVETGSFDDTDRIALETLMQRIFAQ
ncbi:MAG TPA: diguanylate phosphodiesterase, partial [Thalassospira sp.]|nr:diguanylate phosphodiesterase [Thalassospira sp.]